MSGKVTVGWNYNLLADTLSIGTHTVTLNYEAGSVESKLEVKSAATSGTGTTTGAQTGDTTNAAVWTVLVVMSLFACIIVFEKKKRI